jgi:hypothetical protein
MAYSAVLIPNLEDKNSEVYATKAETSWIGNFLINVFLIKYKFTFMIQLFLFYKSLIYVFFFSKLI